jgi:hypothetical protein
MGYTYKYILGWDLGRGCSRGVILILVVKELGFLNVRSGVALPMAEYMYYVYYVPCTEDQHPLPKSNVQPVLVLTTYKLTSSPATPTNDHQTNVLVLFQMNILFNFNVLHTHRMWKDTRPEIPANRQPSLDVTT